MTFINTLLIFMKFFWFFFHFRFCSRISFFIFDSNSNYKIKVFGIIIKQNFFPSFPEWFSLRIHGVWRNWRKMEGQHPEWQMRRGQSWAPDTSPRLQWVHPPPYTHFFIPVANLVWKRDLKIFRKRILLNFKFI